MNPAAYVIDAGQHLMSTGSDWGQDLRTLAAIAASAVILIPASVGAFQAATRRQA